jgi:phosphoribosylformimino-5-aminoimidazole carboxamide ribotide isomerase
VQILPAIDLLAGRVVRLKQGRFDEVSVYDDDPVARARRFVEAGAELLHVVDLDGAASGEPVNIDVVAAIIAAVEVPVQVGGGIRTMATVERLFDVGAARVVLGTALITDQTLVEKACSHHPGIVAGIDARGGKVAINGWREGTEHDAVELARELEALGLTRVVYTDIAVDGMRTGPNLEATRKLAESTSMSVIASGGVSELADIVALRGLGGIEGVIVGSALYEGSLDLGAAIATGREEGSPAC